MKCAKCLKTVCSKCVILTNDCTRRKQEKLCTQCFLALGKFTRQQLDSYTVKELQTFLSQKGISTTGCVEKNDLCDLVFRCSCLYKSGGQQNVEHSQHVELLRERMRNENAEHPRITEVSSDIESSENTSRSTSSNSQSSEERDRNASERTPSSTPSTFQALEEQGSSTTSRPLEVQSASTTVINSGTSPMMNLTTVPGESSPDNRAVISLDDIKKEEDLGKFTVTQLKEILDSNYIDYKGCCEKSELLDRVTRFWKEHKSTSQGIDIDQVPSKDLCKICMDAVMDCILLECGHILACTKCAKLLAECPICRCHVTRIVHVYRA